ncbi:PREDICTED: limbic system-associated membrane protein-like [Branchiostoma belcheri]|uniref:Limbic system-associated membrane protein-like n=1 Tax=Branchiostoma belcheri TaxID=7741 RepID=A0A6P4ZFT6_BRABE|nr:PREDICTED: limbic system-associated membrane protein-like [Branchiostoma belcheri]
MAGARFAELCVVLACFFGGGLAAPSFTSEPGNVTVEVGGTARLEWQLNDDGASQLFELWRKLPSAGLIQRQAGQEAAPFPGYEGKFEIEGVATLKILNVEKADAGGYEFQASYDDGTSLNSGATLIVNYQPTITGMSASPDPNVKEGDDLTLTCAADGVPAPNFSWSRSDGGPLGAAVADAAAGTLTFTNISRTATGAYTCTADNGVGVAPTQDIAVAVSYPTTPAPTTPTPNVTMKITDAPTPAPSAEPEPTGGMETSDKPGEKGRGAKPQKGGLGSGAIVGIVLGLLALFLTIGVGAYCASKRFGPQPNKKPDVVTFNKVEETEAEPLKNKDPENPPEKTEDKDNNKDASIIKNGEMEEVPLKNAEEA